VRKLAHAKPDTIDTRGGRAVPDSLTDDKIYTVETDKSSRERERSLNPKKLAPVFGKFKTPELHIPIRKGPRRTPPCH
jgi:hypothetical protein